MKSRFELEYENEQLKNKVLILEKQLEKKKAFISRIKNKLFFSGKSITKINELDSELFSVIFNNFS